MPAPRPSLILANPAPLNPVRPWPFFIDAFPADALLGPDLGSPPKDEPKSAPASRNRREQR